MPGRYTRHDDHPPLDERPVEIPAECYNCARLMLVRSGGENPVWLDLPGLLCLKLALMPDAWVVADWQKGQMPLLAWTDFSPAANRALHQAVPCALRTYTGSADKLVDTVGVIMGRQLRNHLKGCGEDGEVIRLPAQP